jgi:hypothetical protein
MLPKFSEPMDAGDEPRRRIRPPREMPVNPETKFNDWFDINNKEHIAAYAHLMQNGIWPKHFIPADVYMEDEWQQTLNWRIVKQYAKSMTGPVYRKSTERRTNPEFS